MYCVRQIAGAAGYVIQFDRRTGINRVDLDLFTLASNTHLPSTSLAFQLCPYTLSKFNRLFSFPRLIFIPIYFLFRFPHAVRLSTSPVGLSLCEPFSLSSRAPITCALLLPLLTNTGVRPGITQVCHKQVGGTGRERKGTQDDAGNI